MDDASASHLTEATKEKLRQTIERIERLEEEKKEVAEQIKEVYAEAKAFGFDTKADAKAFAEFSHILFGAIGTSAAVARDAPTFPFDIGGVRIFFDDVNDQFGYTLDGGTTQERFDSFEDFVLGGFEALGGAILRDGEFDAMDIADDADPTSVVRGNRLVITGAGVDSPYRAEFATSGIANIAKDIFDEFVDAVNETDALAKDDMIFV